MAAIGAKRNGAASGRAQRARSSNGANVKRPASLTLRPAGPSDFEPLSFFFDTALRRDYFIRRGQLKEILDGRHHQMFVAEIESVLVGVAITTCGSRLVNALVHPGYRGLGIGRALVESSGATEVRAKLDMSTGDPAGFYRSLGFERTGQVNGKGNIELMRKHA
jgi:ribosomal protein S18 acetylase RimI-like enzyme